MVAEREQREDRLAVVGAARQLDRALEVLARLRGVADAPEHAPEDPVRAAGRARLAEPLRQPQRLLGGVDREHVVARVHVEPGGLLVQAHELQARRPVLQQVDALLVVLDRRLALALVPQRRADLAVQVGHPLEVLLARGGTRGTPPTRSIAASTRPSRSATSPCFSPIRASASRRRRAARGRARPVVRRTPRGSSTASAAASPAASRKCSALRAHRLELGGVDAAPRGRAPRRARSARRAAPRPRRCGRRRAPR